ncbi:DMT family transporter [Galactobacter caseinivorans]|uniref:QacE family quaternary ammonium compound efflux SMR transporter n=1 Tax=Galactobacter caseinivorans TaxID=2676123 RepID=A0A496PJ65_9MICC|nr:SMR family transporter [Galactobacter caseinivorans]RKW70460.1 QacE family quaternary ammonium compound efflux SMR transporter [Galactobacter caseinivorans]
MIWLLLSAAIVCEVGATLCLRMASMEGAKPIWYAPVGLGYLLAFTSLALALGHGMPLGVAYGIWAAAGVALTALVSHWLFKERLTRTMLAGIGLIIVGVLLVELGARH